MIPLMLIERKSPKRNAGAVTKSKRNALKAKSRLPVKRMAETLSKREVKKRAWILLTNLCRRPLHLGFERGKQVKAIHETIPRCHLRMSKKRKK